MKYPKDIYLSPRKAVQRFTQIMQRCHPEAVRVGHNYREEKEALIAAQFLYGFEKIYGGRYLLQNGEYISKDIDISVVKKISNSDEYIISHSLQITEFEIHTTDIIKLINSKQKSGYDPSNLELLISVRNRTGQIFYPLELCEQIANIQPKYKTIWLLLADNSNEWHYHLLKLYPDYIRTEYNIWESINTAPATDFLKMSPKYGKLIKVDKEYRLDLPSCPICGKL